MYLDGKRIAIIFTTGALGLLLWWLNSSRNQDMMNRIEEMETGASSNPEKIAFQHTEYMATVSEAISQLKDNHIKEASLLLNRAYPKFENYLKYQGHTEIAPNLTLRQWHDQQAKVLTGALELAYEQAKQQVVQGDTSPLDMRDFLNNTPFPYIRHIKSRWRTEQTEVESNRVANASNWIVVRVVGIMGSSAVYEDAVRAAIRSKWPQESKRKLVFGGAMSNQEKKMAMRVLRVRILGDKVSYQFVDADEKRGSSNFHETLTAQFELLARNDTTTSTSWDQLPEIVAHRKAPESLTVTFDRFEKKQQADFSKILEEQKQTLLDAFRQNLTTIPTFAEQPAFIETAVIKED